MGTVELKAISGTTINLNLTYTPSVATDEEARTENWYSDYANIAYTIYNETQEKEITNFPQYNILPLCFWKKWQRVTGSASSLAVKTELSVP